MTTFVFYNSYESTTATALTVAGTSVDVDDAGALVTPAATQELRLTLVDPLDSTIYEIIKCTVVAGVVLTIARGQEGTTGLVWPIGTVISARLTAEMLDGMAAGFDNDGDAKGLSSVNLQPARTDPSEVASGATSIAVGYRSKATHSNGMAIGTKSSSASSESIAIGSYSESTANRQISIGNASGGDVARTPSDTIMIGKTSKKPFTSNLRSVAGFDFIGAHNWHYDGAADLTLTAYNTTQEMTIYSDPVNLGSTPVWAASSSYEHGDTIFPTTPNGFCYVAYIWDANYITSGTSGGTEPTWGTTKGGNTSDNGISWVCVDPGDYEFVLPDYLRFIPTEVGFIAEKVSDTTQPFISFGITGNLTKWLASTQTTKLTGDLSVHKFDPTNTEGAKQFGADLVTAGVGQYQGRYFMKGYVVENFSA